MKHVVLITAIMLVSFVAEVKSQKLGATKTVTLELLDYSCGDNCYIDFKDVSTGEVYNYDNIDEKTDDAGILSEISGEYDDLMSENSSGKMRSVGKLYTAELVYKKVRVWVGTQYGRKETKKWTKSWIMKSISKSNWK